ncbi:MAG: hypothetical protein ACK4UO_08420 [Pseudolabrys sp.]
MAPDPRFAILGRPETTASWNGEGRVLAVNEGATMTQTPNGSMILAFENQSKQNNQGKIAVTSGGAPPQFLAAPALLQQPQVLVRNWQGNNLNVTNISVNENTPIWIAAYGPGIGAPPQNLPIGQPISVPKGGALQGIANPNWMQLTFTFSSSQLAVFGIIGGPADATGNNAYVVAVNSSSGDTGPPPEAKPPPGYYATRGGNTYSLEFNWGASVVYVAYFGSGQVVPPARLLGAPAAVEPTVKLISFSA